jgi:hypothetical protein
VNYVEALDHKDIFGPWFSGPSWKAWRTIERAIFGLPIPDDEMALFKELTGRAEAPDRPCTEAWLIAGRRSAKSRKAAVIATYLCTIGAEIAGYRRNMAPGETGTVLVMAVDRRQAAIVLDYARALFREIPLFRALVARESGDGVELTNGMALTVLANDFRSIRGRTIVACILDEVSYWRHELTRSPDLEVYRAAKPGLATVKGSLLIGISSPYRRAGLLWRKFKRHWGKAGDVLVVRARTEVLNPEIDKQIIAEAYEDDPEAAAAEWGAQFREDLADYVRREVVEALVSTGTYERPPERGTTYRAFTDPSGGSADGFTVAVAHREGEVAVLDCLRERRPPFSPEAVTAEFAEVLKSYGLRTVTGDRYAGEWPREQFRKRGIEYRPSDKTKSEIYLEALPLLNGAQVDLLDDDRLVNQICGLERRTARGGKDSVDHPPHGSDDLANAALGAAWLAAGKAAGSTLTQIRLLGV